VRPISRYYPRIYLEGKLTRGFSQDIKCRSRDSNLVPPQCNSEALLLVKLLAVSEEPVASSFRVSILFLGVAGIDLPDCTVSQPTKFTIRLTTVTVKSTVLWDLTLSNLVEATDVSEERTADD
jgi:hypothetical protein